MNNPNPNPSFESLTKLELETFQTNLSAAILETLPDENSVDPDPDQLRVPDVADPVERNDTVISFPPGPVAH